MSTARRPGRLPDTAIDARVLAVATRHLSERGYHGMSISAVAEEAGTTRQAVHRRWPDKVRLAGDALLAAADDDTAQQAIHDPLLALENELLSFQHGVSRPGRMSLVGTMLQDATPAPARRRYQHRVVAPRRTRILAILQRAQDLKLIDTAADLEIATTMATGSWYARALAGEEPPANWPQRTAHLIWAAVGGHPSTDSQGDNAQI